METLYIEYTDYTWTTTILFLLVCVSWIVSMVEVLIERFMVATGCLIIMFGFMVAAFATAYVTDVNKEEAIKEALGVEVIETKSGIVKFGHNERALLTNIEVGKVRLEILP